MDLLKDIFSKEKIPFVGWLGPKCFIVIDHPDDIQTVLSSNTCLEKSQIYKCFNRGVGLFSAPGTFFIRIIKLFLIGIKYDFGF